MKLSLLFTAVFSFFLASMSDSVQAVDVKFHSTKHRHDRAEAMPPIDVAFVVFSNSDRSKKMNHFKEYVEQAGQKVTSVTQVKKSEAQNLTPVVTELLKDNQAVFVFGGTGFTPDDKAADLETSLSQTPIDAYQKVFFHKTLTSPYDDPNFPMERLALLTNTKAFFTKEGGIVVSAPGSLHGGKMALEILIPNIKHLLYQRHVKSTEPVAQQKVHEKLEAAADREL